ncbi:MAG: extracellular solute-binding protein [Anaerolineae bacterium]|nr:extracellular solute-binding protein [Anaerolineae bacterium]
MTGISRRRLLRTSALALAGVIAAACAPAPTAAPGPTAQTAATEPATQPTRVTPTEAPRLAGKLSVMIWGSKQDVDEVRAVISGYQSRFPEVTLDIQEGGCGPDYAACKTLIAGGSMVDVFVPGNWVNQSMIRDRVLLELDPFIDRDGLNLDDFYPAALNAMKGMLDNKVYALPMGYHITVIYYNKDHFDKAGLPYPPADGNYTWHDLREWARKLTLDANGNDANSSAFKPEDIKQWGFWTWPFNSAGYESILLAFGGSSMSVPDGRKCNMEHPDTIRAFQFIQDMIWKDHSTMTPQADQENAGKYRFAAGEVAMLQGAHWMTTIINDQNPSLRNDVAAQPREKAGNATNVFVHGWGIYSGAQAPELAWHFVRYVSTEGAGPEMGLIPAYTDLALSDIFLKRPGEPEHLKEAFLDPASWPLCMSATMFNEKFAEITGPDGMAPAIEMIFLNEKPAAEALAGLCEKIDAIMAS